MYVSDEELLSHNVSNSDINMDDYDKGLKQPVSF